MKTLVNITRTGSSIIAFVVLVWLSMPLAGWVSEVLGRDVPDCDSTMLIIADAVSVLFRIMFVVLALVLSLAWWNRPFWGDDRRIPGF